MQKTADNSIAVDLYPFNEDHNFGTEWFIRDDQGNFVAARTITVDEAYILWEALKWINGLVYSRVIIELDCKEVVDNIYCNISPNLE